MGTCMSQLSNRSSGIASTEDRNRSKEIDSTMRKERVQQDDEIKLLLLGAGESGKSTIFKQMKILHQAGYQGDELAKYDGDVHSNSIKCMHILIEKVRHYGFELGDLEPHAEEILELTHSDMLSAEQGEKMTQLWKSEAVQQAFKLSNEYQLPDSASYFLSDMDRICARDYKPTQQDVLRVRIKTTGIVETSWELEKVTFRMYDVGGQRSERRKWIHYFDNVTAVIFVAALSEYDQKLEEDNTTNRMQEALTLFDQICNSKYFTDTSMILFLNKTDLFKKKIEVSDLRVCFPQYTGGNSFDETSDFIEQQFVRLNRNESRQVYVHKTCATNTDNIAFVFNAVKDIIIQNSLRASGF